MADMSDENHWFRVIRPSGGRRVNVISMNELYVLVRTKRLHKAFCHRRVQQSDYMHAWEEKNLSNSVGQSPYAYMGSVPASEKDKPRKLSLVQSIVHRLVQNWLRDQHLLATEIQPNFQLSASNPGLEKMDINLLVHK